MCGSRDTFASKGPQIVKWFAGVAPVKPNDVRWVSGAEFKRAFPSEARGFSYDFMKLIPVVDNREYAIGAIGSSVRPITRRVIFVDTNKPTKCGAMCRNAKGPMCDCSCKGENHGASVAMSRARFAAEDLDLQPTQQMADNAARGLALREKHGRGGTSVGVARARDIKNRKNLSPETVQRMHSFFSRHEGNQAGGEDDAGYIAWLLWGGDAGKAWAARKAAQIDKSESARGAARKATMARDPVQTDWWKRFKTGNWVEVTRNNVTVAYGPIVFLNRVSMVVATGSAFSSTGEVKIQPGDTVRLVRATSAADARAAGFKVYNSFLSPRVVHSFGDGWQVVEQYSGNTGRSVLVLKAPAGKGTSVTVQSVEDAKQQHDKQVNWVHRASVVERRPGEFVIEATARDGGYSLGGRGGRPFPTKQKAEDELMKMRSKARSSRPGKATMARELIGSKGNKRVYVSGPDGSGNFNVFLVQVSSTGVPGEKPQEDLIEMKSFASEARARSAAQKMIASRPGAKTKFAANNVDLWNFLARSDWVIDRQSPLAIAIKRNYATRALKMPNFTPPSHQQHGPSLHDMARDALADIKKWEQDMEKRKNRAPWNMSRAAAKTEFSLTGNELYKRVIDDINDMQGFVAFRVPQMRAVIEEAVRAARKGSAFGESLLTKNTATPEQLREFDRLASVFKAMPGYRSAARSFARPGAKTRFNAASAWLAKYLPQVNAWWRDHTDYPTDLDASSDRDEIEGVLEDIAEHCREAVPREAKPSWYAAAVRDLNKIPNRRASMRGMFGVSRPINYIHTESNGGTWKTKTERYGSKKATIEVYIKGGIVGSVYQDPDNPRMYKAFSESDDREIASGSREACKAAVEKLAMSRHGAKAKFDLRAKIQQMKTLVAKLANTLGFKPDEVTGNDQMMHILFENQPKQADRLAAALRTNLARVGVPASAITTHEHYYADDNTTYGGVWIDLNALANASGKMSRPGAKATMAKFKVGDRIAYKPFVAETAGEIVEIRQPDSVGDIQRRSSGKRVEVEYGVRQAGGAIMWISEGMAVKASRLGAKAKFAHPSWSAGLLGKETAPQLAAYSWIDNHLGINGNRTQMMLADLAAEVHARNPALSIQQAILKAAQEMVQKGVATYDIHALVENKGWMSRPGAKAEFGTPDEALKVFETLAEAEKASINGNRVKLQALLKSIAPMIAKDRAKLPSGAVAFYDELVKKASMSRPGEADAFALGAASEATRPEQDEALTALAAKVGREHTVSLFKRWSEGKASMSRQPEQV